MLSSQLAAAITRLLDEQLARLEALGDDATVEDIARAVARPIIEVLSDPQHPDRALPRIFDRTLSGPPGEMRNWLRASLARLDEEVIARLRQALPGTPDDELRFRWDCATGILRALAAGTARTDLHDKDLERLLLPVLAGTLSAGGVTASGRAR